MNRTKHTALAFLLTLCLTLGLLPALTPTANAADVSYLYYASEADAIAGKTSSGTATATPVTADLTAWSGTTDNPGWYVVNSDVTIASRITVTGDVRLILADGFTLTASAGITVAGDDNAQLSAADTGGNSAELKAADTDGNSLTIYAQSTGAATMGKLSATGGTSDAGGGDGDVYDDGGGAGGAVTATGGEYAAGIGGGANGAGGTITVNGGAVTATGDANGAGIGGGANGAGGTITVNGGAVTATGGATGAGIGGGGNGAGGTITVNGGAVTATGGTSGAGIGGGQCGAGGTITVNGGEVTANGGLYAAGIGGGDGFSGGGGASGKITITGGTVNANGNGGGSDAGGAGIGGGDKGNNSGADNSISITGGTVTATVPNGTLGAAIGNGGDGGTDVTVTIGGGATVMATVMAGTSSDGTGAAAVTDVANNANYKYAKITFAPAAPLDPVSYLDWDATNKKLVEKTGDDACDDYTLVTESDAAWNTGWYVVSGDVTISERVTVTGAVSLILCDGATLNASKGITVQNENQLTVYAQNGGTGKLIATASSNQEAGIGAYHSSNGSSNCGTVTIKGGVIEARGKEGAGIGGAGENSGGGNVTIYGGSVTAVGEAMSTGIGSGWNPYDNNTYGSTSVTIYGGEINATGGQRAAGIGGGTSAGGITVEIYGGIINAKGGSQNSAGIGYGDSSSGRHIIVAIHGGDVTASGVWAIAAHSTNEETALTVDDALTVKAGDDAASAVTVSASAFVESHTQKYAKITFAASAAPEYTVTAADTTTETDKKYQYGDAFTIAVTVSGADFEGGEFTLTYDKDMFQLTAESVAPGKNDNDAKNTATGNKFNADSDGKYAFILNNRTNFKDGDAIVTLTFKVTGKTTEGKAFDFAFDTTNPPKICYDTDKDSVAATATKGSVTLTPILYAVTLTPNPSGDFTLTGDNGVADADNAKAVDGQDYVVTIGGYDANNYSYDVALSMTGNDAATAPTPDADGKLTIAADNITGDFTLTVTRTLANFTVTVSESDYVTGWALILVAKDSSRTDSPVYCYDSNPMYYVNAYNAYAYLVEATTENPAPTVNDAKTKVTLGTAAAGTITNGATDTTKYDVNGTGKTDYSDALLTYRCYIKAYQTPGTAMETYLRADVNGDKKADTTDVSAIDANRTPETT